MRIRHHSIPIVVTLLFLSILSPALADDYEDANRLLSQGKHAAALKKVDAAIASNPQDARAIPRPYPYRAKQYESGHPGLLI